MVQPGLLLLLLSFILLPAKYAMADEPPCWCNFKIESANKQFCAVVNKAEKDSLKEPWSSEWTLSVYHVINGNKKLLWKTVYNYSGYSDGYLSDDGNYFVYVEYWYYADAQAIKIYKNGTAVNTASLKCSAFKVPFSKLAKTVSHWLWLADDFGAFQSIPNSDKCFLIKTRDGNNHLVDLDKGVIIYPGKE